VSLGQVEGVVPQAALTDACGVKEDMFTSVILNLQTTAATSTWRQSGQRN
jgi:hypothetical protein